MKKKSTAFRVYANCKDGRGHIPVGRTWRSRETANKEVERLAKSPEKYSKPLAIPV